MRYLALLLAILGVHLLAVASPGPAFVATLRVAGSNSRRAAISHSIGLALAALTWAAGAMLGMQTLMVKAAWLYRIVELAGGLYLTWLGIQSWRHAGAPIPAGTLASNSLTNFEALRKGYLLNIANPKVMVFFASIFAAMLPPAMPIWMKLAAVLLIAIDEGLWYSSLALFFSTSRAQTVYRKAKRSIDRIAGVAMLLFGGKLIENAVRG
jgi:threonine efflux protein